MLNNIKKLYTNDELSQLRSDIKRANVKSLNKILTLNVTNLKLSI
jgi:hypothetical protein